MTNYHCKQGRWKMDFIYGVPLLFYCLCLNFVAGTKEYTVHACTKQVNSSNQADVNYLHLRCDEGLIYVLKAVFGQSKEQLCQYKQTDTCLHNALYARPLVSCQGKTRCAVPAAPVLLERCNKFSDYLQVNYQCITGHKFGICGGNRPVSQQGSSNVSTSVPLVPVGQIMTPNFPERYQGALYCQCMVTAAISYDTRIEFELLEFHLEANPGCSYDYVELLKGDVKRGPVEDRMCGGMQRRTRKTIESRSARVVFQTNERQEYTGFWMKVWATSRNNLEVPVTVDCRGLYQHLFTHTPPIDKESHDMPAPPVGPSGDLSEAQKSKWKVLLNQEDNSQDDINPEKSSKGISVPKNTAIIVGVCVCGLLAMVIINIVGFLICRYNMNNRGKQNPSSSGEEGTNSSDSFSSMETEYVSLNSNGANYHSSLCDSSLYTTHVRAKDGCRLVGSIPPYDLQLAVVERTPGVEHSVEPSEYDYGMLPETYTRRSRVRHPPDGVSYVISQGENGACVQTCQDNCGACETGEELYSPLRRSQGPVPEGTYATIGRRHSVRIGTYRCSADYDEINDYNQGPTDINTDFSSHQNSHTQSGDCCSSNNGNEPWSNDGVSCEGPRPILHPLGLTYTPPGSSSCRPQQHSSLGVPGVVRDIASCEDVEGTDESEEGSDSSRSESDEQVREDGGLIEADTQSIDSTRSEYL